MYTPELQEVIRLSKDYNLIPVVRHLLADTETPIRVFQHFYQEPACISIRKRRRRSEMGAIFLYRKRSFLDDQGEAWKNGG